MLFEMAERLAGAGVSLATQRDSASISLVSSFRPGISSVVISNQQAVS